LAYLTLELEDLQVELDDMPFDLSPEIFAFEVLWPQQMFELDI
jgi:hypothetical protein